VTFMELDQAAYQALFEHNPRPILVNDRETLRLIAVNHAA